MKKLFLRIVSFEGGDEGVGDDLGIADGEMKIPAAVHPELSNVGSDWSLRLEWGPG